MNKARGKFIASIGVIDGTFHTHFTHDTIDKSCMYLYRLQVIYYEVALLVCRSMYHVTCHKFRHNLTNLVITLNNQVLNYHLSRDRYANIFYGILMIHDILLGLFILHTASIL